MLPKTTLCLLVKDDQILLAMKKRGFGLGKWNGYGGKPEAGETIEEAAQREMEEEIGISCELGNLIPAANLIFYFKSKPEWDQEVVIFLVRRWSGEPQETEEMRPQWFRFADIPYEQMWPDDRHWLPRVLAGERLSGEFYFNEANTGFESFRLEPVNRPEYNKNN